MSKRKQYKPKFKAKVALEALKGESDANLTIMATIDRQFQGTPFYGAHQMTWYLRNVRCRSISAPGPAFWRQHTRSIPIC